MLRCMRQEHEDPLSSTIQQQLQHLLQDKARLAEENSRLQQQNAGLQVRRSTTDSSVPLKSGYAR